MKDNDRFWAKVHKDRDTGCWLWVGCKNHGGYGYFHVSATKTKKAHMEVAHRISYIWKNGAIPEGVKVLHNCPAGDNPACVNPDHLFLGTHEDNMQDCKQKGRMRREGPRVHLTEEQAIEVIEKLAEGKSQRSLAGEYGVSVSAIHGIAKGRRWIHLERDIYTDVE